MTGYQLNSHEGKEGGRRAEGAESNLAPAGSLSGRLRTLAFLYTHSHITCLTISRLPKINFKPLALSSPRLTFKKK